MKKLELHNKSPNRSRVTSPVESSSEQQTVRDNSMLRQLKGKSDFFADQQKSAKSGTVSGMTQNRNSSIVSDSKLTQ